MEWDGLADGETQRRRVAGKPLAPSVLLPRPGPPRLSARSTCHACPSSRARPSKDVMENDLD